MLFKVAANSAGVRNRHDLDSPKRALDKLCAQALAALGAARGQYTAAAYCLHAGAESMGALAFDLAGLISAFHLRVCSR